MASCCNNVMDKDKKGTSYSYPDAFWEIRKQGNVYDVYNKIYEELGEDYLAHVKRVIIVGPGPAISEIAFLKKLTKNVVSLIVVEKNQEFINLLKVNVEKYLPDHIDVNLNLSLIQDWQGPDEKVDLILMFHCLYYVNEIERKDLFEKCFKNWLNPDGKLIIKLHRDKHETKIPFFVNNVYRETDRKEYVEAFTVKQELKEQGYTIDKVIPYEYYDEMKNLTNSSIFILQLHADPPFENETIIKSAFEKLYKNEEKVFTSGDLFSVINKS